MDEKKNIKYIANSTYFPKFSAQYTGIFKALEIDDNYNKAFEIIKNIPPLKIYLWQLNQVFFKLNLTDVDRYLEKICNEFPNEVKSLVFIQVATAWEKAHKTDNFTYHLFYEELVLSYSLIYVLKQHLPDYASDEIFLTSQLKNLGLLAIARSLPGIYNSFMQALKNDSKTNLEKYLSVLPEELDVLLIEKWIIGSTIIPYIIHFDKPDTIGKDKEGIRIIKHARFVKEIIGILFNSPKNNKISVIKRELKPFISEKHNIDTFISTWINVARQLAAALNIELETFTNVFFENLNIAEVVDKQLIVDDLKVQYFKLLEKYNSLLEENKILKKQSIESVFIDNVTKIYNHGYFYQFMQKEVQKSIRYEYPIALLFIDIDFFHVFNETYGYNAGNDLLRNISDIINKNVRESDLLARYNNDDLVVLLPHTGINNAMFVAEKMRKLIFSTKFKIQEIGNPVGTTVSVGVSAIYPPYSFSEKDTIIKSAQKALEFAKKQGGNRVEVIKI